MSIVVEKLSVFVNDKQLLNSVSETLESGEILGVVGENGAGKSTLLNAIAGIQKHEGVCRLNGTNITAYSPIQLAAIRAVLPQETHLSFPLKVIEVVRLASSLATLSTEQETHSLWECLQQFSVKHLANRDFRSLSGGEKQRVQLARVTAQLRCHENGTPQFLLLDEPIAALDLHQQLATLKSLRRLAKMNIGIFMIIHDINLASIYCDKLLVLKNGHLISSGSPNETVKKRIMHRTFNVDLHVEKHPDIERPILIPRLVD